MTSLRLQIKCGSIVKPTILDHGAWSAKSSSLGKDSVLLMFKPLLEVKPTLKVESSAL